MIRLSGLAALMRPTNMLICAFSTICGGIICGKPLARITELAVAFSHGDSPEWGIRLVYAALSAAIILAAGNTLNDVMDVETDRINAPWRPIPSQKVSRTEAMGLSVLLFAAGVILALPLGPGGISIALAATVLLALYDFRLKGVPLAGNITVSALGGLAFIYGGVAGGDVARSFVPAIFAFLLHLGRELIKDAEDFEGDRAVGLSTAATAWSVRAALRLAAIVLSLLLLATAAPFFTGYFGFSYAVIILLGVWPAVRYGTVLAFRPPTRDRISKASLLLKFAMPMGILAVLAGFQGM